ncbi:MAG: DedA family protein [Candidatus Buchananbacteria bacterium]
MQYLHQIVSSLGHFAITVISFLGYFGIFILMVMESMIIPIPSEAILPFGGFLVESGDFNFWLVLLAATFGSLIGSLISYYIGYYGGNAIIKKWGKYLLLDEDDLAKTESWFSKRGELTIFIGRFIPVVRHLISIPAGIGKMDLKRFCIYTFIGAGIWNGILIYIGMILGQHWEELRGKTEYISIAVAVLLVVGIIWFVLRHLNKRKK